MKSIAFFVLLIIAFVSAKFDFTTFAKQANPSPSSQPATPPPDDKGVNYYFPPMVPGSDPRVAYDTKLDIQQLATEMVTLSFNLTEMQQQSLNKQPVVLIGEFFQMKLTGSNSAKEFSLIVMAQSYDRQGNVGDLNAIWEPECDSSSCTSTQDIEDHIAINCNPDINEVVALRIFVNQGDDDDDNDDDKTDLSNAVLSYSIAVGYVKGECRSPLGAVFGFLFSFLLLAFCFWCCAACFVCCWYKKKKASKKVKKTKVTSLEENEIPLISSQPEPPTEEQQNQNVQIQYIPVYIPVPQQNHFPMQNFYPQQQPYVPLYPAYSQHQ